MTGRGKITSINSRRLAGWFLDPADRNRKHQIVARIGDRVIGKAPTGRGSRASAKQRGATGFEGFAIRLDVPLTAADLTALVVEEAQSGTVLPVETKAFIQARVKFVLRELQQRLRAWKVRGGPRGRVHKVTATTVTGWAFDPGRPQEPLQVGLYVDDVLVETRLANDGALRPPKKLDPAAAGHGFRIRFPPGLEIPPGAALHLRILPGGRELDRSPAKPLVRRPAHRGLAAPAHLLCAETAPPTAADAPPSIAVIVLNRNGATYLEALFASVERCVRYPDYRIRIVDHGSTDSSLDLCTRWSERLPIEVIARGANYSFSASNNFAADRSPEDILFFLNNDIILDSCLLTEAAGLLQRPDVGVAGFRLVSPADPAEGAPLRPGFVQHLGVRFGLRGDRPPAVPYEMPALALPAAGAPTEVPAVCAAALAMTRADFEALGGFDERYFYCYEDIDLCLGVREVLGKRVVLSNEVWAYHLRGATRSQQDAALQARYAQNLTLLLQRFGDRIRRTMRQEIAAGRPFLRPTPLRIAFACAEGPRGGFTERLSDIRMLGRVLARSLGWEVRYLSPRDWYDLADVDLIMATTPEFSCDRIAAGNPWLTRIAWIRGDLDDWVYGAGLGDFDLLLASSDQDVGRLRPIAARPVVVVWRPALGGPHDSAKPAPGDKPVAGFGIGAIADYDAPTAGLASLLDPEAPGDGFALFGKGWESLGWLAPHLRAEVGPDRIADILKAGRIVVHVRPDKAGEGPDLSALVHAATTAGTLVVTNDRQRARDEWGGLVPVFETQAELATLTGRYLRDEPARKAALEALTARLQAQGDPKAVAEAVRQGVATLFAQPRIGLYDRTGAQAARGADHLRPLARAFREAGGWIRLRGADTAGNLTDIEASGDDVSITLTSGPVAPETPPADRIALRLHMGPAEDLSLTEARLCDALVVPTEPEAATLRAAGIEAHALFATEAERAAAYRVAPTTGALLPDDIGAFAAAFDRIAPTLLGRLEIWRQRKADTRPVRFPQDAPAAPADPVTLVVWPDWREKNPYQQLLYADLPAGLDMLGGTLDEAIALQQERSASGRPDSVVFHLHWTTPILGATADPVAGRKLIADFAGRLDRFRQQGGRLVWTVHNILPHDTARPELEAELCAAIAERADMVMVHGSAVAALCAPHYRLPDQRIRIAPHGSYIGVYPDTVTRRAARVRLGIPEGARVLVCVGLIRRYKGIDALIDAFSALRQRHGDLYLVIAGRPLRSDVEALRAIVDRHAEGMQLFLDFVPDEDLQVYFRAADFAVLPYRDVLTSGALLMALSFATPVIAPSIGLVPEVIEDGAQGYLFDPGQTDGLAGTLERAALAHPEEVAALSRAAGMRAQELDWSGLRRILARDVPALTRGALTDIVVGEVVRRCVVASPETPPRGRVAIAVLHYGDIEDTIVCVQSLLAQTFQDCHVFIVSNDETGFAFRALAQRFPGCTIIQSPENLGYAGGNNLALALARGSAFDLFWIVNPDIIAPPDYLSRMVEMADEYPQAGIFGSTILQGDHPDRVWFAGGTVDWSDGLSVSHDHHGRYFDEIPKAPARTDYMTGASLFFRAGLLEILGYLPEQYFLYFEETHWCQKARAKGIEIWIFPEICLHHHKRSDTNGAPTDTYLYYYTRNALIFCRTFAPDQLSATEYALRRKATGWLEKVLGEAPDRVEQAQAIVARGIADGLDHTTI